MPVDAVVLALTGERHDRRDAEPVSRLAAAGWTVQRVRQLRDERIAAGQPWPFPVASADLPAGFAAFAAELVSARELLGLLGDQMAPATPRPLNADERRLAADRPPHWG